MQPSTFAIIAKAVAAGNATTDEGDLLLGILESIRESLVSIDASQKLIAKPNLMLAWASPQVAATVAVVLIAVLTEMLTRRRANRPPATTSAPVSVSEEEGGADSSSVSARDADATLSGKPGNLKKAKTEPVEGSRKAECGVSPPPPNFGFLDPDDRLAPLRGVRDKYLLVARKPRPVYRNGRCLD